MHVLEFPGVSPWSLDTKERRWCFDGLKPTHIDSIWRTAKPIPYMHVSEFPGVSSYSLNTKKRRRCFGGLKPTHTVGAG